MRPLVNHTQYLYNYLKAELLQKRGDMNVRPLAVGETSSYMVRDSVGIRSDALDDRLGSTPAALLAGTAVDDDPRTKDTIVLSYNDTTYKVTERPSFDKNGGGLTGVDHDVWYYDQENKSWEYTTDGFLAT